MLPSTGGVLPSEPEVSSNQECLGQLIGTNSTELKVEV